MACRAVTVVSVASAVSPFLATFGAVAQFGFYSGPGAFDAAQSWQAVTAGAQLRGS